MALGKAVFGSSTMPGRKATEGWENAVDGRTRVRDFNLIFHTGFELYPWLSIALGGVGLVKNITLYNRIDNYGNSSIFSISLFFKRYSFSEISISINSCSIANACIYVTYIFRVQDFFGVRDTRWGLKRNSNSSSRVQPCISNTTS